jgi:SAM-dependent methyltransferase
MLVLRIYNTVSRADETMLTLPGLEGRQAMLAAERFMRSRGLRQGKLVEENEEGESAGKTVYGFPYQNRGAGFRFIPNSEAYWQFRHLKKTLGLKVGSFVDLGGGPGNILLSARYIFGCERVVGVEIDPKMCEQARGIIPEAEIVCADISEWTPPDKKHFDMVYVFEPTPDLAERAKFFAHLRTWLKAGQYLFYTHATGDVPRWLASVPVAGLENSPLFTVNG